MNKKKADALTALKSCLTIVKLNKPCFKMTNGKVVSQSCPGFKDIKLYIGHCVVLVKVGLLAPFWGHSAHGQMFSENYKNSIGLTKF